MTFVIVDTHDERKTIQSRNHNHVPHQGFYLDLCRWLNYMLPLIAGSFFSFFYLLHLAGLIHHLAVHHCLCNDLYNLPCPHIWFFCKKNKNRTHPLLEMPKNHIFSFYSSVLRLSWTKQNIAIHSDYLTRKHTQKTEWWSLTFGRWRNFFHPVWNDII